MKSCSSCSRSRCFPINTRRLANGWPCSHTRGAKSQNMVLRVRDSDVSKQGLQEPTTVWLATIHCKSHLLDQTQQLPTVIHMHALVNQLLNFAVAHVQRQHPLHPICQPNHRELEATRWKCCKNTFRQVRMEAYRSTLHARTAAAQATAQSFCNPLGHRV